MFILQSLSISGWYRRRKVLIIISRLSSKHGSLTKLNFQVNVSRISIAVSQNSCSQRARNM